MKEKILDRIMSMLIRKKGGELKIRHHRSDILQMFQQDFSRESLLLPGFCVARITPVRVNMGRRT